MRSGDSQRTAGNATENLLGPTISDLAKLSPQESKKLAIKEQRRQARMLAATVAVLD
jgi:hypothetical protein